MKKFLTVVMSLALSLALVGAFSACGNKEGGSADQPTVNLVATTGEDVGLLTGIDYYVVPEPAATLKANKVESLSFAGDLQKLYGEDKGYPQAVIVAKCSLLQTNYVQKFLEETAKNKEWLLNETTTSNQILEAISAHLPKDYAPTFNAANLNKTVISNCGINLTNALSDKDEVTSFMLQLNKVSGNSFGLPLDEFFHDGNFPATNHSGTVNVYMPDGAPALGLAKLMNDSWTADGVETNYNIVDASTIFTYVTGKMAADICVLPVNIAVGILGSGSDYKMVGTLTHGNLYLLKMGEQPDITAENISALSGKTVAVVNLAQVPGLTFKTILKKYGLNYSEVV